MGMIYPMVERRCDVRVHELRAEFGSILAERIVESEAADFLWEARVAEHYLGQHFSFDCTDDELDGELSRMAFLSCLCGEWHAGVCLVDSDGIPVELVWKCKFATEAAAEEAFGRAN